VNVSLLNPGKTKGLEPGSRVRFTIDADKEVIVKVISADE